jgi:hypothetical protein
MWIPRHLSEGIELGHSNAVRLRIIRRMDLLLKRWIPRHLSEGFWEWATQAPFGLGKLTYGLTAKDRDTYTPLRGK